MALFIVQHGLSLPEDIDPERGLSAEGRSDVERIASVAAGYGVRVAVIVHSGKKRAMQTAEIMASHLHPDELIKRAGINPADPVEPFAATLDVKSDLMIVGHLPFLERLVSHLILGRSEPRVFRLQKGGILCLDSVDGAWVIKWSLMPRID